MAHGRVGPDLVMNTRYVGASEIRSVSEHELDRTPDGSSAIDPLRSHLNEVLHGPRTQTEAVAQAWASGVRPPAKQAERPFVQMVLSASPEYFRDDEMGPGEWSQDKLDVWLAVTMTWLKAEYGDDLAHVSLHLDEDTPHLHVLVIPTYEKAARKPGRMKRGETPEQFEERKRIAAETVTRAAGRASSPYWSRHFARREARKSYHAAVESLGIGYGRDFVGEATGERPQPKTTGAWVREQAAELRDRAAELEAREKQLSEAEAAAARRTEIQARWDARRDAQIMARFEATEEAAASATIMSRHAQEKARELREHAEQVRIQSIEDAVTEIEARRRAANADIEKERTKLDQRRSELDQRADELDLRSSELNLRADELDQRADEVAATEQRLHRVSDRLNSALEAVYAGFKFIAEKLGVRISKGFNAALADVEAALEEAEAALAPTAPAMRIAAASAAPEEPGEESDGPGL